MKLWYLAQEKRLVTSLSDSASPAGFDFMRGDTEDVEVHACEPVTAETLDGSIYREVPLLATTIKLWIGGIDLAPEGGTWTAQVGVNATAEMPSDVSRDNLSTALNALASVIAAGGIDVFERDDTPKAANFYLVKWRTSGAKPAITFGVNKLVPKSRIEFFQGEAPDDLGTTLIELYQYPPVFQDQFFRPTPAAPAITRLRAGSGVQSEVQRLTLPAASSAIYAITHASVVSKPLAATASAANVAAALNALFTDGKERFLTTLSRRGVIDIAFTGDLANAAQELLTVQVIENPSAQYAFAQVSFKGIRLRSAMRGLKTFNAVLELEITNGETDFKTPLQVPAVIHADAIPDVAALASDDPTFLEPMPANTPAHDPSQVFHGSRSYDQTIGDGVSDNFTITHDLNSLQVHVRVAENTGGGKSFVQPARYRVDRLNVNQVKITFLDGTIAAADALDVSVIDAAAEDHFLAHTHFFSQILKSAEEPDVTLVTVLTAILAGQNSLDLWPLIPINKIGNGSITADKLDLASFIATFFGGGTKGALFLAALTDALTKPDGAGFAKFVEGLREVAKDSVLVTNLLHALTTSATLAATFESFVKSVATKAATLTEFATAIKTAIGSDPALGTFFRELVIASLQNGTAIADSVIMAAPDLEVSLPAPATANGDLPNGDTDGFFPLPVAIFTTLTNDGNLTGALPDPTPSLKGHYRTVVDQAYSTFREFTDGQIVYCTGDEWFPGVLDSGKMFTTDGDLELFTLPVNDKMLSAGTRFSILAGVLLQQLGNCEGRWLFKLERCSINAEASGTPGNISTLTVDDTIFSEPLTMDDTAIVHNFGFAVAHTSLAGCLTNATTTVRGTTANLSAGMSVLGSGIPTGAKIASITNGTTFLLTAAATTSVASQTLRFYAATKTLYTVTDAAIAPADGKWILRGSLSRYDAQNVATPRGVFTASMKGVRASIVKLT